VGKVASQVHRAERGVGRVRSTDEGGESRWREGALLDDRDRSREGTEIVATLRTPEKLRQLQRALWLRAKKDPGFRAYALYDKVYRTDVLAHAYALVRANGGAPGPDGCTFEDIEMHGRAVLLEDLHEKLKTKTYRPGPVRRVYIPKLSGGERPLGIPNIRDRVVQMAAKLLLEPLFEADFDGDSYGFRPKKSAHQALDAIHAALAEGMCWVLDADVTAYFDTIPHDRLMKVVAERVVDGAVLALVKMVLEAPIVDERAGGTPRGNTRGTPQGGVISPLLANIYLNLLDRNYRRRVAAGELQGRLIRYADDFVVLSQHKPGRELAWIAHIMRRLGLELHPEKTRVVAAPRGDFTFLGHRHFWRWGRLNLLIGKKARQRIRDEIRRRTRNKNASLEQLIYGLNLYIRGARQYFSRVTKKQLKSLDIFVDDQIARWSKRKHERKKPDWALVWDQNLRITHGLEAWYRSPALVAALSRRGERTSR
jgi:group II intron reverse transcriptase/maturase